MSTNEENEKSLFDQIKDKAAETWEKTKEVAEEVADKAEELAGEAKIKAEEFANEAKQKATETWDKTKEAAEEAKADWDKKNEKQNFFLQSHKRTTKLVLFFYAVNNKNFKFVKYKY